jgi:phage gp16-like protein
VKPRVADADARRRELAKIHILADELGMDTDDQNPQSEYRSMLFTVTRETSTAKIDQAGRLRVLDHLAALKRRHRQAAPTPPVTATEIPAGPDAREKPVVQEALRAMLNKIERQLEATGKPWAYAHAIAESMFKVKRLEWLAPPQMHKVVSALEYHVRRHGKARR